jgi:gentisate 1,2-dioxygenase
MPDDLAPRGYYEGLTARSLMAGWARREQSAGSRSEMLVHVWRAAEARAALQEASRFVGTDVAERRNLIMVNPAPGNTYATTRNIVAAYQMIQPGETARSHRHTPAAPRQRANGCSRFPSGGRSITPSGYFRAGEPLTVATLAIGTLWLWI